VQETMGQGKYPLDGTSTVDGGFAADFRSMTVGPRARDNEFLVGCMGDENEVRFMVAYDGNAIDEDEVARWKHKMETLLEEDPRSRL